jgi:hypothetical protein
VAFTPFGDAPPVATPYGTPSTAFLPELPRRSRKRWVVMGTIVAVVIVVVIIVLAGVLHSAVQPAGATYGTPLLYSQVTGPAALAQGTMKDGPWAPVDVLGLSTGASGVSVPGSQGVGGCTSVWTNSSTFVVPATPSNATAGQVSTWIVASQNATGAVLLTLVSSVNHGIVAANVVLMTGTCTATFREFGAIPGSVIDSSTAVSEANAGGGSSFLAQYSAPTKLLGILGPYWTILYSTCSYYSPSGSGNEFEDFLYAVNGTTFDDAGTTAVNCA